MARKTARMNICLDTASRNRLEAIQGETKAISMSEVIRRALAMYEFYAATERSGGEVFAQSADGIKTKLMLL